MGGSKAESLHCFWPQRDLQRVQPGELQLAVGLDLLHQVLALRLLDDCVDRPTVLVAQLVGDLLVGPALRLELRQVAADRRVLVLAGRCCHSRQLSRRRYEHATHTSREGKIGKPYASPSAVLA